jgi:CheY-like chemotaxis protein
MPNILIVDDQAITLRMLGYTLRRGNHETYTADSGQKALDLLDDHDIDLVICDISMPGMDGITLLRQLRADARYATLPVVMLTASGREEDRIAAQEAGATDFLTKPTSSGDLLSIVEQLLAKSD